MVELIIKVCSKHGMEYNLYSKFKHFSAVRFKICSQRTNMMGIIYFVFTAAKLVPGNLLLSDLTVKTTIYNRQTTHSY